MDICFQVLKFYPEGSTVFVDHDTALVAAGKATAFLPDSAVANVTGKASTGGSGTKENQITVSATEESAPSATPPPAPAQETPHKELPNEDGEVGCEPVDETPQPDQRTKKGNIPRNRQHSDGGLLFRARRIGTTVEDFAMLCVCIYLCNG